MRTYDVVIAGGGLIGSAIALELARAGLQVALFDRQEPGKEASWASAGILSPAPESPAMIPLVPLGTASMALYPSFIGWLEELTRQNTGFRPKGTLVAIASRTPCEELNTIIALHHGLGLSAEPLSASDARALEPELSSDVEAAVLRPAEASVDNRALTNAVLDGSRKCGVRIFAESPVLAIWKEGQRCTGLIADGEKIAAKHTIIAAGSFSAGIEGASSYARVRPAKGQMISLRSQNLNIERVLWSENIYIVPRNDGRILAGATVEYVGFDKTVTAGGISKLTSAAIELVPALKDARIEESWAGLRPDTPDHLPILGPVDVEGLLFATGHFRSGVLLAPITAKLIREWIIENGTSLDCARFSPMRFLQSSSASASASVSSN
jgi:glycine oxidase